MRTFIKDEIEKICSVLSSFQHDAQLLRNVEEISRQCTDVLRRGRKILFAGNGGSAADSQHLAAELVGRLRYARPGLAGIALTTDTSALTAITNDYSFEYVFARQIEAIGQEGDAFIGISTSGKSKNIVRALEVARARRLVTIGFTGNSPALMAEHCDLILTVPSTEASKIQEVHIVMGHIICSLVEEELFGASHNPARK